MNTTLTPRETFRQTVAAVAARAKARLPQAVNGRVESAIKLVMMHNVVPQADGSIEVGSASDPMKVYKLVGTACECQDFTRGQAPDGWCQHRIAAGIQKRVQEVLPQSTAVATEPLMLPAPAPTRERSGMRLETSVMIDGRQVKVAVWGPDDADVQARLQAVLAQHPLQAPVRPQGQSSQGQGKDWCPVHQTAMQWNTGKEGRKGWYSHRTDDGWCKGR
jgi:hypothetical protein